MDDSDTDTLTRKWAGRRWQSFACTNGKLLAFYMNYQRQVLEESGINIHNYRPSRHVI